MKTKFKTLTEKNDEKQTIDNNFSNSQNYIIGNNFKIKLLDLYFKVYSYSKLMEILFVILYFILFVSLLGISIAIIMYYYIENSLYQFIIVVGIFSIPIYLFHIIRRFYLKIQIKNYLLMNKDIRNIINNDYENYLTKKGSTKSLKNLKKKTLNILKYRYYIKYK